MTNVLLQLAEKAQVTLTVLKQDNGYLVSVVTKNDKLPFLERVPPLVVRGTTPEELETLLAQELGKVNQLLTGAVSNFEELKSKMDEAVKETAAKKGKTATSVKPKNAPEPEATDDEGNEDDDTDKADTSKPEKPSKEQVEKEKALKKVKIDRDKLKSYYTNYLQVPDNRENVFPILLEKIKTANEKLIKDGKVTVDEVSDLLRKDLEAYLEEQKGNVAVEGLFAAATQPAAPVEPVQTVPDVPFTNVAVAQHAPAAPAQVVNDVDDWSNIPEQKSNTASSAAAAPATTAAPAAAVPAQPAVATPAQPAAPAATPAPITPVTPSGSVGFGDDLF